MPRRKKTFVEKNFLSLVTLLLVLVVLLQRCDAPKPSDEPKIVRDTVWVVKDSLITSKPQLTKTIQIESHDTIINHYIPDTNYAALLVQYQDVVKKYLATNLYSDSVRIDTIGYVKVTDTVSQNQILKRGYRINVKYPIITNTVTLPAPKKNQLYVGGEVEGSLTNLVSGINAGLLFKNKKDQIFGLKAGLTSQGQPNVGVSSFWKITLKK